MKKHKYFFAEHNSETCYQLAYHIEKAKEEGLTEIVLYPAIPEKVHGMFWCADIGEPSDDDGFCGRINCKSYQPRNGKWGICKHKKGFYVPAQEPVTIKVKF